MRAPRILSALGATAAAAIFDRRRHGPAGANVSAAFGFCSGSPELHRSQSRFDPNENLL